MSGWNYDNKSRLDCGLGVVEDGKRACAVLAFTHIWCFCFYFGEKEKPSGGAHCSNPITFVSSKERRQRTQRSFSHFIIITIP